MHVKPWNPNVSPQTSVPLLRKTPGLPILLSTSRYAHACTRSHARANCKPMPGGYYHLILQRIPDALVHVCSRGWGGDSSLRKFPVDVLHLVDNQYVAIPALWTLTTPVPWDGACEQIAICDTSCVRLSQRVYFLKNISGIKTRDKGIFWYKRVHFGRISKQPKTEERLAVTRLAGTPCMRYPNNPTDFLVLLKCRMPYLYLYFLFWRCLSVLRRVRMTPQLH
jgi:hypothetical protein